MPGFLKANLSEAQAQSLLCRFTQSSVDEITSGEPSSRLYRLSAVLLYVTQPTRKISFNKQTKNFGSRKMEVDKYHRFVVFGIPGTTTIVAMFSPNSEESRRLFRYNIGPGSHVQILKPTLEGQLSRGGSCLISTKEPLVPSIEPNDDITLPPYDVEGSCIEFRYFSFVTKNLLVDSAVIAESVCPGKLCDGQTYHENCPCLETSQTKIWNLLFDLKCPEMSNNHSEIISFYSNETTGYFVTPATRKLKGDSDRIDRFDLDNSVQLLVQSVNETCGFRVSGWFKPAIDEEGTTLEHKNFHVCSLKPESPLTSEQEGLKYSTETTSTGASAVTAETGSDPTPSSNATAPPDLTAAPDTQWSPGYTTIL